MSDELDFDTGTAGASARREYERRKARREAEVRKRHPHAGNLLLRFRESPQHEQSWATGASGEQGLAACLTSRCPGVIVLNDRAMPGSRANIDHLAIGPSGVTVIDAKRYKGKIEVRKPFFGDERLVISGRNKTKLVDGLEGQLAAVRAALESLAPGTPCSACFCFLDPAGQAGGSGIPLFRTLTVRGYPLLSPKRLAKRLNRPGALDADQVRALAKALAAEFPSA